MKIDFGPKFHNQNGLLAEIFVKQGNYPKAIKIYEQLMLSIPEKKLFFASRINYIKQKTQP